MNGILLVNKPEGLSSAAVVRLVKKALAVEKIGHLGTLDPFASGLLPLCLGTGTKVAQFLIAERKAYIGTIRLGVETDTLDKTGTVTRSTSVPQYGEDTLRDLERRFTGDYQQTPPMYSALKRNGVPLYKLARRGVVVEREPRRVTVEKFALAQLEHDLLGFSLTCSKGTYVRVLAADIGAVLGCGAHLASLCRTEFGEFSVRSALPLQVITETKDVAAALLSPAQAMRNHRSFLITLEAVARLRRGQQDVLRELSLTDTDAEIASLLGPSGELVAIVENQHGQWRLLRVL
ncbi:MAG: tRNA pseudouridine(55) synthase TruB [Deltaproteobacteria bacterium]|nr:tRNA pseudouridine(55) synthase TruB [Deltaproteobacteria bacterium]